MNNESPKIKTFTDLNAWKESHGLVLFLYKVTKKFPILQGLITKSKTFINLKS